MSVTHHSLLQCSKQMRATRGGEKEEKEGVEGRVLRNDAVVCIICLM